MRTSQALTRMFLALTALFLMSTAALAADPGAPFSIGSEVSDQKAGSILFYNIYTSGATSGNAQNTRINITNTSSTSASFVHLFFVADTCQIADSYLCLTANQTASFLASDVDPGVSGYILALAVDGVLGCPVSFNWLTGDEYVKFSTGHAANLGAVAFSALFNGLLPGCDANSTTVVIPFDGVVGSGYDRAPAVLALDSIPSRADGNDTLVIINRAGGNLGIGAFTLSSLFGLMYDDSEAVFSFSVVGGCQLRGSLSNTFPRTTPRFDTVIPAGRTGWLKVFQQTGVIGILGAAINLNSNATASAGAFNGGRNMHHLRLAAFNNTNGYIVPIFPPRC